MPDDHLDERRAPGLRRPQPRLGPAPPSAPRSPSWRRTAPSPSPTDLPTPTCGPPASGRSAAGGGVPGHARPLSRPGNAPRLRRPHARYRAALTARVHLEQRHRDATHRPTGRSPEDVDRTAGVLHAARPPRPPLLHGTGPAQPGPLPSTKDRP
ncbi:hypothetical protein LV779_22025 [Streptomyces thinghirensis]|nr:hypothetical protein [Streptomyces thinghirensis]